MAPLCRADVPSEVDSYHSLFPLEALPPPNRMQKTSNFGYITSCYKAVNSKDDLPYCLRRIHGSLHALKKKHRDPLRESKEVKAAFFFSKSSLDYCVNNV